VVHDVDKPLDDLPDRVRSTLEDFLTAATRASADNLRSAILFGSAAEGRLRPASDVNLILVFREVQLAQLELLREDLAFAHAAIGLKVMFLAESEIEVAAQAFAVKFTDILSRHRVLYGSDVFGGLRISRAATLNRLRQVLVNLTLRLRERYALVGAREERLNSLIADVSGPIRACAAAILGLEGGPARAPKESLEILARRLPGSDRAELLANLSSVREERSLEPAAAAAAIGALLELLNALYLYIHDWS
jgi:predicted nucleotidyltransferase